MKHYAFAACFTVGKGLDTSMKLTIEHIRAKNEKEAGKIFREILLEREGIKDIDSIVMVEIQDIPDHELV